MQHNLPKYTQLTTDKLLKRLAREKMQWKLAFPTGKNCLDVQRRAQLAKPKVNHS